VPSIAGQELAVEWASAHDLTLARLRHPAWNNVPCYHGQRTVAVCQDARLGACARRSIVGRHPLRGSARIAAIGLIVGAVDASVETEESGEANEEVEYRLESPGHEGSDGEPG